MRKISILFIILIAVCVFPLYVACAGLKEQTIILSSSGEYIIKALIAKNNFVEGKLPGSFIFFRLDGQNFRLSDFTPERKNLEDGHLVKYIKKINLSKGSHEYELFNNDFFNINWVSFVPTSENEKGAQGPQIFIRRIHPARYLVDVSGAKEPFWLVFDESFGEQWKVYRRPLRDYVCRIKPGVFFDDLRFLWEKPLDLPHREVNYGKNGWRIEQKKYGLGESFGLTIFYESQAFFVLGILLGGVVFLICLVYLIAVKIIEWKGRK